MSLAGLLDDRRAELLNGVLIEMPAQALPHMASISKTAPLLFTALAPGLGRGAGTLILSRFEMPEPDFHVYGVPVGTPRRHRPLPLLVIEISDSYLPQGQRPQTPHLRPRRHPRLLDREHRRAPHSSLPTTRKPHGPPPRLPRPRRRNLLRPRPNHLAPPPAGFDVRGGRDVTVTARRGVTPWRHPRARARCRCAMRN